MHLVCPSVYFLFGLLGTAVGTLSALIPDYCFVIYAQAFISLHLEEGDEFRILFAGEIGDQTVCSLVE